MKKILDLPIFIKFVTVGIGTTILLVGVLLDPGQSKTLWGRDDGKDPPGGPFENWNAGEIHGAFEVIQSLDEADAELRYRVLKAVALIAAGTFLAAALFFLVANEIKVLANQTAEATTEIRSKIEMN